MGDMIPIGDYEQHGLALCFSCKALRILRRTEAIKPSGDHVERTLDFLGDPIQ